MPLYRVSDDRVHVFQRRAAHARSVPDVLRHEGELPDSDIAVIRGIPVTALQRTVLDLARVLPLEAAVSQADAALRAIAVTGQEQDGCAAEAWRESLTASAPPGARGVRQARWVIAFSDGRAQLPGESVSRLHLHRLGFRVTGLQVPVRIDEDTRYWIDFDLEEAAAWGEFDGESKYLDPGLRGSRRIERVLLDEKRREDIIRGQTGRRFVRWGDAHIRTPEHLGSRLAQFGVYPGRH